MSPLIFIVGSTAIGKTDLAFQLAKNNSSCLVNADSIQIYKDLNIGSSKPNFKQHPQTDCFLFDVAKAPQVWTAGDFRRECLKILKAEIPKRPVLLVGGSGFYIQSVEKGMYNIKDISQATRQKIQDLEEQNDLDWLYQYLQKKDSQYAKKISSQDRYRIVRALQIIENEGKSLTQIQKDFKVQKLPWKYQKIGLQMPKDILLDRVKQRAQQMLTKGLIEEVDSLVKKGQQDWKPLQSVGYKEALLYLKKQLNKEQLLDEIIKSTMALAKKQKTWFQKDKDIKWYDHKQSLSKIQQDINWE